MTSGLAVVKSSMAVGTEGDGIFDCVFASRGQRDLVVCFEVRRAISAPGERSTRFAALACSVCTIQSFSHNVGVADEFVDQEGDSFEQSSGIA